MTSAIRWGMGFLRHGDHRRAKKYFTVAVEVNPSDGEALIRLTFANAALGDFKGAQQAARLPPERRDSDPSPPATGESRKGALSRMPEALLAFAGLGHRSGAAFSTDDGS